MTLSQLMRNGWFPGRKVNITEKIRPLAEEGWAVFPVARIFLESFDGLPVFKQISTEFNCLNADLYRGIVTGWETIWGRVYPVAVHEYIYSIYIDEKGRLMLCDADNWMYVYGDTTAQSLQAMFSGSFSAKKYPLERIDND